jgi:hypothetical protein
VQAVQRRETVMPFPSRGYASLAGQVGGRNRWINHTPEERRAAMERVRAGQRAKYVERAAAMAAEKGWTPTLKQLEAAADALRLADLAAMRIRAWDVLNGSR